ncbi:MULTISPECIES: Allophycocyanin subunit alpha 2 [unclassified Tolypothrix]|uniref:Allophycocyanin alpha chain 2 n=1 Tax=Microchaete diplosiphon TaxID=1197 RepID=PHAA2_MICDP|nr:MULTISPECIES: Allophycocyanin subunit alpha 2 [unclassified Tolypothrix]P16572.2 RecName: Full=Allophycocyanin alpha chain 2 [Microchaete diplosiphon]pir/B31385/ allophycocyanin 2 alpha chain - Calothrix sp. (PCC 7601) [Calothrix sp.]BAY93743.1 allophycocyanin alpha chain 2 [Microchaete diplosiphon NIES-3275]AAA24877.1 allophycocyanin alpha subunit (apcA2) [Microchaete diplosiphon]EKF03248.1 allophycocyanin alpha subunit [Tolypothrix sp. PCC 7601]MBE9082528.1 Allophycocyanin subunit alpha 
MSIITKMILNADAEVRYLTPGELDQINIFVKSSQRRLQLVEALTQSRATIVKQAGKDIFQRFPRLVAPGGNAYGENMTATCLRDMDYYLRLITYSVAAGDTTPIQEIGIVGVRQMYRSLGTPIDAVAESVRAMKNITTSMLSGEDASEVGTYFDYLITNLQ